MRRILVTFSVVAVSQPEVISNETLPLFWSTHVVFAYWHYETDSSGSVIKLQVTLLQGKTVHL